jgi:hypothetical protein
MTAKIALDNTTLSEDALGEDKVSLKDQFLKKKKRVDKQKITLDGNVVEVTVEALPQRQFDDLVAAHPKRRNKEEDDLIGANSKTFPPALFAASVKNPQMSHEEWTDVWTSEEWSPGELGHLLNIVLGTTSRGFDVPFGGRG